MRPGPALMALALGLAFSGSESGPPPRFGEYVCRDSLIASEPAMNGCRTDSILSICDLHTIRAAAPGAAVFATASLTITHKACGLLYRDSLALEHFKRSDTSGFRNRICANGGLFHGTSGGSSVSSRCGPISGPAWKPLRAARSCQGSEAFQAVIHFGGTDGKSIEFSAGIRNPVLADSFEVNEEVRFDSLPAVFSEGGCGFRLDRRIVPPGD